MDVKGKTKESIKARLDVALFCNCNCKSICLRHVHRGNAGTCSILKKKVKNKANVEA
jgi:hypothetical protein